MKETAIKFGKSLDEDDYATTLKLLSNDCAYHIGEELILGPKDICNSYESNMIDGRKKFDYLEWGNSQIELIRKNEYYVHFTDYLGHKGESYTHRCKQKLFTNDEGLIFKIEHVHNEEEQTRLNAFKKRVGLIS